LSQIDETIEKETAYKEKLQHLKKGLMEDILTGKVRVKV
jgi:type I restriction enzyme S subunit